jgi:hypothetical protein
LSGLPRCHQPSVAHGPSTSGGRCLDRVGVHATDEGGPLPPLSRAGIEPVVCGGPTETRRTRPENRAGATRCSTNPRKRCPTGSNGIANSAVGQANTLAGGADPSGSNPPLRTRRRPETSPRPGPSKVRALPVARPSHSRIRRFPAFLGWIRHCGTHPRPAPPDRRQGP